jgi:radical SAM protein with 4Fe4S-binding SPASM domain
MQITRDVPPFYALQIEPTEGCNLACSFCALQSIRDNGADAEKGVHGKNSAPYKFMTLETMERLASEVKRLGWNPRWEYAMHGEPTMNPQLTEMIAIVRKYHPRGYIMLTTNGGGLVKDSVKRMQAMFDAGLNTLALDHYNHANLVPKIRAQVDDDPLWSIDRFEYPRDDEGNPHRRHNGQKLVFIHDISQNTDGTHTLTNQGGNSFPLVDGFLAERCAKPFRELSVRWDGFCSLCCDDWPGKYKIGNVNDTPLEDIWYHERFEAARRRLYAKDRNFGPCRGCDVRTVRNGLLPDKLGKATMPAPDEASERALREAMRGKVFSIKPV